MTARVVIVGAGPAGCAAAIALAQRGVTDILLLDRARFPRDKTCGSAISPLGLRVLADLGVEPEVRRLALAIHSLLLTTPGGRKLHLRGGEAALVLLRKEFDQLLVDRARALGVRFRDGVQVTGLMRERERVAGVRSADEEIRAMARDEISALEARETALVDDLRVSLLPRDPNDDRNVIVEIRAGAGGEEAALFASELLRMYSRYAERQGWRLEVMSSSDTGTLSGATGSMSTTLQSSPGAVGSGYASRLTRTTPTTALPSFE